MGDENKAHHLLFYTIVMRLQNNKTSTTLCFVYETKENDARSDL